MFRPSVATVTDGTYPISRELYMYFQNEPKASIKDYLDWILSADAQTIVTELGFVPVSEQPESWKQKVK